MLGEPLKYEYSLLRLCFLLFFRDKKSWSDTLTLGSRGTSGNFRGTSHQLYDLHHFLPKHNFLTQNSDLRLKNTENTIFRMDFDGFWGDERPNELIKKFGM